MSRIPGRAETDEEKRVVLAKLLEVWKRRPHARLGQLLIANGIGIETDTATTLRSLFYIEDEALVERLESRTKSSDE